ncbi:hypothetical protein CBR_g49711 [Chara braunii]|uniref:Tf2-1-like SH3-like domain-containing protein n=1 Tax=Chara braunii TaxID=69332 RepID=A0A388M5W1_CHABU|nr:hypothetical protein CBR_g49711 [Chara braunii]|eukprot:GBG89863.1 hypothetical protein CBR_g49711 [Chara braunii]
MQEAQVRMQQQANRHHVPCPIRAGDLVWVCAEELALEQEVSRKLLPKWFGPWPVASAAGDEPDGPSFVINIPPHLTVHPVFHASKLATYTLAKSDDFPGRRSQDPPFMDGHQEVDRAITDRKYGSKPRQYKVSFKACDRDYTRWISGAKLKASAPLIYAHYEKQRLAQEASRPAPPTRTMDMPEKKKESHVRAHKAALRRKYRSLFDEGSSLWGEIRNGTYDFDLGRRYYEILGTIAKGDLIAWYDKNIMSEMSARKIAIQIWGKEHKDKIVSLDEDGLWEADGTEEPGQTVVIRDQRLFQTGLSIVCAK